MLDEHAGSSVGKLRHDGFLKGFGIKGGNKQIACVGNGAGSGRAVADRDGELPAEEPEHRRRLHDQRAERGRCLDGAQERRQERRNVTIVSVDGGCAGVRNVKAGVIDATSQQYPLRMASLGVAAVVKFAQAGAKATGYTDTGLNLIAKKPVAGVPSKNVAYGLANCWG